MNLKVCVILIIFCLLKISGMQVQENHPWSEWEESEIFEGFETRYRQVEEEEKGNILHMQIRNNFPHDLSLILKFNEPGQKLKYTRLQVNQHQVLNVKAPLQANSKNSSFEILVIQFASKLKVGYFN